MDEHLENRDCCLLRIIDLEGKVYIGSTTQPVNRYLKGLVDSALQGTLTDENSIGHAIIDRGLDDFSVETILITSEPECRRLKPIYVEREGTLPPDGYNIWPYRQGASQKHCVKAASGEKSKARRETNEYKRMIAASLRQGTETREKRAGYPTRKVLAYLKKYPDRHNPIMDICRAVKLPRHTVKSSIHCLRKRGILLVNIFPIGCRLCVTRRIFAEVDAIRKATMNMKGRSLDALGKTPEGMTCSELAEVVGITKAQARDVCYGAKELEKMPKEKVGVAETRFRLVAPGTFKKDI